MIKLLHYFEPDIKVFSFKVFDIEYKEKAAIYHFDEKTVSWSIKLFSFKYSLFGSRQMENLKVIKRRES